MKEELWLIEQMEKSDRVVRNSYKSLQKKYPNEYIALDSGKVIVHNRNLKTLIAQIQKKNIDIRCLLVQYITKLGESVYFFYSHQIKS